MLEYAVLKSGFFDAGLVFALFLAETVVLIVAAGSSLRRRPRFARRLVLSVLAMPALLVALSGLDRLGLLPGQATVTVVSILVFLCVPGLMLIPGLLFEPTQRPPGADGGSGGDGGPDGSPPSSPGPQGELPLPGSEPGRWRRRDHARPWDRRRERRPAPHPDPTPTPTAPLHGS